MKKILFELAEKGLLENLDIDNLDEVLRVIVKRKFKKLGEQKDIVKFYNHLFLTSGKPSIEEQVFIYVKREFENEEYKEILQTANLKDKIKILYSRVHLRFYALIENTFINPPSENEVKSLYVKICDFYLTNADFKKDRFSFRKPILIIKNKYRQACLVWMGIEEIVSEEFDTSFEMVNELLKDEDSRYHNFISKLCDIEIKYED